MRRISLFSFIIFAYSVQDFRLPPFNYLFYNYLAKTIRLLIGLP